jgi:SOS response regulatory protein OraA/RecX
VDEIYAYALRLLKTRDYTVAKLDQMLQAKFGVDPREVIQHLIQKNFLNDRRFAENYARRRKTRGAAQLREELVARGVEAGLAREILAAEQWPSLREALAAKMNDLGLSPPVQSSDAVRLFRALARLGYDEDSIREELERLRKAE